MKKIFYLFPFIISLIFYIFIIIIDRANVEIIPVILLLSLLLLCGFSILSQKKKFNIIGVISLFVISAILIIQGIKNNYAALFEVKLAIFLLLYYLILLIIEKRKKLIIMNGVVILILLILFVPVKTQYRDGGTVDYKAIAYRVIKWNRLLEDGNHYIDTDIYLFPKNIHSFEYYTPVDVPNIIVTYNGKDINTNKGSSKWSKIVDGDKITQITDVIGPFEMNYTDSFTITDNEKIKVNTIYYVSSVKYYADKENITNYNKLYFDNKSKTINLDKLENGEYIIEFNITNGKDNANYLFKIEINR